MKTEGLNQPRAKITKVRGKELAVLDKEAERFREKNCFHL